VVSRDALSLVSAAQVGQGWQWGSRIVTPGSAAAYEALALTAMIFAAAQVGLLAAELEARGFLAGVGKFILVVIIVLVVGGALLGFAIGRRR
jgi:hypothetical protein